MVLRGGTRIDRVSVLARRARRVDGGALRRGGIEGGHAGERCRYASCVAWSWADTCQSSGELVGAASGQSA